MASGIKKSWRNTCCPSWVSMDGPLFLQDGAPCHASKCIKAFLAQQDFQVIDWPGNSPDLNPIENCWNHLKNMLKKKDTSSVPKLISAIKELWTQELTIDY
jgi:transposase